MEEGAMKRALSRRREGSKKWKSVTFKVQGTQQ